MSYKIRYDYDRYRRIPAKQILLCQCVVSGVLLCMTAIAGAVHGRHQILSSILSAEPVTLAERAVAELSGALAAGEGWYRALAVWCRTVIDGAAV